MATVTKEFVFTVWYFKDTGKFYTEAEFPYTVQVVGNGTPYMNDVVSYFRERRGPFPGLQSGSWEGPILINHPEGFPCLIL